MKQQTEKRDKHTKFTYYTYVFLTFIVLTCTLINFNATGVCCKYFFVCECIC